MSVNTMAMIREAAQKRIAAGAGARAEASKRVLDSLGQQIAAEVGGRLITANVKSMTRASYKVDDDYGGDWLAIKDLARITIAVRSNHDIERVVLAIKRRFVASEGLGVVETKVVTRDNSPTGYSGTTVFVRTNASDIGEIQVNTLGILYSKLSEQEFIKIFGVTEYTISKVKYALPGGLGHILYERYRVPSASQAEFADLTTRYHDYFRSEIPNFFEASSLRLAFIRHNIVPYGH
jgi:hypothetical protein